MSMDVPADSASGAPLNLPDDAMQMIMQQLEAAAGDPAKLAAKMRELTAKMTAQVEEAMNEAPLTAHSVVARAGTGSVDSMREVIAAGVDLALPNDHGPSRAKSASCSLRRALLMPQVHPGSRYRCGKRI